MIYRWAHVNELEMWLMMFLSYERYPTSCNFSSCFADEKKRERKSSDSRAGASDDDIASVKEERHHGGLLKSGRLLLSDETSAGWRVRRKFSNKITQHSDVFIDDDMLIELRNL